MGINIGYSTIKMLHKSHVATALLCCMFYLIDAEPLFTEKCGNYAICDLRTQYCDRSLKQCDSCESLCLYPYYKEACEEYCRAYLEYHETTSAIIHVDKYKDHYKKSTEVPMKVKSTSVLIPPVMTVCGLVALAIVAICLVCYYQDKNNKINGTDVQKCSKDHEKDKPTQDIHIELQPVQQPRTVENDIPPFESEDKLSTRHGGPPTSPGPPSVLRQGPHN